MQHVNLIDTHYKQMKVSIKKCDEIIQSGRH